MIVTDLAARGIDIPKLQNVINYNFPTTLKLFIHRCGRTARAGEKGNSFTFITNDELAYLHDISAYVGKKITDKLIEGAEVLTDPEIITYGRIPQNILDEYCEHAVNLTKSNKDLIEGLEGSLKKSLNKYNRTKDQASSAGMQLMHGVLPKIHPLLLDKVDEKEDMLMSFREAVKNYKPRASTLEIGIVKSKDEVKIGIFKSALKVQIHSKILKE